MPKLEEVFGVRKEPVLSYLSRNHVDSIFQDALQTDRQIIVYGSSKQGKTSLVERYVPYKDNISISCSPKTEVTDIYKSILRQVNIEIVTESETKSSVGAEASLIAKVKARIPFIGGEVEAGGKLKGSSEESDHIKTIEFNLALPQDIFELLKKVKSNKFVILENFHYLDDALQKQLSFDLRTFQELGVRFVILGVWREKNRLAQFNGDLLDRVVEIPVEPWQGAEFEKVLEIGEEKLNIKFSQQITKEIIEKAFDSIGVVQELAKAVCQNEGVLETQKYLRELSNLSALNKAVSTKTDDYSARHIRALEDIAKGQKATKLKEGQPAPLFLPHYLIRTILSTDFDNIVKGIKRQQLEDQIKKMHHRPDDVRPSDMSNLLYNLSKMQNDKGITPPIFDFDKVHQELKIIDSTFYFFLRNTNTKSIITRLASPLEESEDTYASCV
ncbi:MAG: hypothetical protein HW390_446 [Candidatus Brocadiaceae bacterium]|nr:hypothetical protein [Candidatus Brocadiaceae bacterium]